VEQLQGKLRNISYTLFLHGYILYYQISYYVFVYVISISAILAYATDIIFTQTYDKSEKYIKEFNKKKGWWRTKWKIITILPLILSLWFALETSSIGTIGQFLISLHT